MPPTKRREGASETEGSLPHPTFQTTEGASETGGRPKLEGLIVAQRELGDSWPCRGHVGCMRPEGATNLIGRLRSCGGSDTSETGARLKGSRALKPQNKALHIFVWRIPARSENASELGL